MNRRTWPQRKKTVPQTKGSEWIGNIILWIMGFSGTVSFCLFILGGLFILITKGVPAGAAIVANWWEDTSRIIIEHHWQFTDGVLYLGIVIILVLRYTNFVHTSPE